ncbi:MAG: hypothetical protein KDD12_25705 [Lewinella sp.]|nr:hypothetical protein [Lewinella sp.]
MNGGGGETTNAGVLAANAGTPDAVVDWVFIELRDAADPAIVLRTVSALVQRDGDIVDASTGGILRIQAPAGSFYVSVKHRNHLGAMTAQPVSPVAGSVTLDFTQMTSDQLFNNPGFDGLETTAMSSKRALWAGNANADGKVKYDGSGNDRVKVLSDVIQFAGNTESAFNYDLAFGYFQGDINMDGKVKYDGSGNDRVLIQAIVVVLYPPNQITQFFNYDLMLEQLP